jgi:hypothetical protein
MALNGKKPVSAICGTSDRHHGSSGTSRGYLFVRQGASYSALELRPATPPSTVSGIATSAQSPTIARIVPNGRAAVERYAMATVFRQQKTKAKGPQ